MQGLSGNAPYVLVHPNDIEDLKAKIEQFQGVNPVWIPKGIYDFDNLSSDIVINTGGTHIKGVGKDTIIRPAAAKGFSIADTALLRDISFKDIYFQDNDADADYAIKTTDMADGIRLTELEIDKCYFIEFIKAAAVPLQLHNLETSWITRNYLGRTRADLIKLTANDYDAGNITIADNFFSIPVDNDTSDAIHIEPLDNDGTNGSIAGIHLARNHYLSANVRLGTALRLVATAGNGDIDLIDAFDERTENTAFLATSGAEANDFDRAKFSDCNFISSIDAQTLVALDQYAEDFNFENCLFEETGAGGVALTDANVQTDHYNKFKLCHFRQGTLTATHKTRFVDCDYGTNLMVTKVSGVSNWRNGGYATLFGASNNNLVTATDYTVRNGDALISVTGGTVNPIVIKDPAGNTVSTYPATGVSNLFVPHGWIFNITYTVLPTLTICWIL